MDIPSEILNLLVQVPLLFIVWYMFIRPMVQSHQASIDHYRNRQKETDEWMRRMMEVWSGERLDAMDADAQGLKKIEPGQTQHQPSHDGKA